MIINPPSPCSIPVAGTTEEQLIRLLLFVLLPDKNDRVSPSPFSFRYIFI